MADRELREIGRISDIYSAPLAVTTRHGYVGVGPFWLTAEQADELAALLIQALLQAEREGASR